METDSNSLLLTPDEYRHQALALRARASIIAVPSEIDRLLSLAGMLDRLARDLESLDLGDAR